jgi:hypothetical protein
MAIADDGLELRTALRDSDSLIMAIEDAYLGNRFNWPLIACILNAATVHGRMVNDHLHWRCRQTSLMHPCGMPGCLEPPSSAKFAGSGQHPPTSSKQRRPRPATSSSEHLPCQPITDWPGSESRTPIGL